MVRKIIMLVSILTLIVGNCYAMQFSQPQKIGRFGITQAGNGAGGVVLENASKNSGSYFTKYRKDNRRSYERGIARFGDDEDSLYVHYNVNNKQNPIQVGGVEKANTVAVPSLTETVFKISTNEGITIYLLYLEYGPEKDFTIIGRQKNGKFVKYINTVDITNRYFEWGKHGASPIVYTNLQSVGNTLVVSYATGGFPKKTIGEFRFKWDDKAQWFGVEQVAY